jgi:hypothetical protein
MRYRVYHVFSFDGTDMKKRKGCILIDMQNLLFELWSIDKDFNTIPRKRITFRIIGILMDSRCFRKINISYLDYIRLCKEWHISNKVKEYELLPHNSNK